MKKKQRLGELLIEKGLVTEEQIQEALRLQVGGNRRLGYLLIKLGIIDDDQLLDILSHQLEIPIVSIADQFSSKVKGTVPRYLCRKYSVIPLALEKDNILNLAMTDPSDDEAISDIENYTGLVVKPFLARHKDLESDLKKYIPFTLADIFNQQVFTKSSRVLSVVTLALLLTVSVFVYRQFRVMKYGKVSVVGSTTVYENHDLMVSLEEEGKISLLGHGAYAKGFYSVRFDNVESLRRFLVHKKDNFSEKQNDWLFWVINNKL
jgi:hypothetical protein